MSGNTIPYQLFHNGILALSEMEQQGFRIDMNYINSKKDEITREVIHLEKRFKQTEFYKNWPKPKSGEVNIYSSQQISNYVYGQRKHKIQKQTANGNGATDEEALMQLGIPELNTLVQIKKLKKVRDTYLEGFAREQVDGVIHPFYNLHLVKSFRSSSDSPNWQNIPKRDKESMDICRKAIFPRKGHQLLEIDYAQLEVRIAACYNEDAQLIHDILHGDMHKDMACEIFGIKNFDKTTEGHSTLRQAAKNGFVFPEFYGDYYKNCAVNLASMWGTLPKSGTWKVTDGIKLGNSTLGEHLIKQGYTSLEKFTKHIQNIEDYFWKTRYKTYTKWKDSWWEMYQKQGFVESKTGFVYSGVMRRNEVINYPIQGSAFHCLLLALIEGIKAFKREKMDSKIIGQIHDAVIIDVNPKELEKVVAIMKCIMCNDVRQIFKWINVPLDVDAEICPVDASWAEKQPYKFN